MLESKISFNFDIQRTQTQTFSFCVSVVLTSFSKDSVALADLLCSVAFDEGRTMSHRTRTE